MYQRIQRSLVAAGLMFTLALSAAAQSVQSVQVVPGLSVEQFPKVSG